MKKGQNWWGKVVKRYKNISSGGKKQKRDDIPKEIMDGLPPGVKIKRIEINPMTIMKTLLYVLLGFWLISLAGQWLVGGVVEKVDLSKMIGEVKDGRVEKLVVMDNEIMAYLRDEDKVLTAEKESGVSLTEILQKEEIDISQAGLKVENRAGWKMLGDVFWLLVTVGLPLGLIVWMLMGRGGAGGVGGII